MICSVPVLPSSADQLRLAVHSHVHVFVTAAVPDLRFRAADHVGQVHRSALRTGSLIRLRGDRNGARIQVQRESVRKKPSTPATEDRVCPLWWVGPRHDVDRNVMDYNVVLFRPCSVTSM